MMKRLTTVDQIIDAFGGERKPADNNKAIAQWLGLNTSAVCNWRERQNIPSGWHLRFWREAGGEGWRSIQRCSGSMKLSPRRHPKKNYAAALAQNEALSRKQPSAFAGR